MPTIAHDIKEASLNHEKAHDELKQVLSNPSTSENVSMLADNKFKRSRSILQTTNDRNLIIQKTERDINYTTFFLLILDKSLGQ